jgi:hypothetical protein
MPIGGMTDLLDEAVLWFGDKPIGKMKDVTISYADDFGEETEFEPITFSNDMSCEFTCTYSYVNKKFFDKLAWNWRVKGPIRKKQILKMRRKYYGY